jgi:hypothetical protein
MDRKPITIKFDLGNTLIALVFFTLLSLFMYLWGEYQGKWNTIETYKTAKVQPESFELIYDREGNELIEEYHKLVLPRPELKPNWLISNPQKLDEKHRNPQNLLQRIYSSYPDILIKEVRPSPRKKVEPAPAAPQKREEDDRRERKPTMTASLTE